MPAPLSKEEVINRIKEKHNDKIIIDDNFVYKNTKTKVKVLCEINDHGYFEARPETLIGKNPNGCPKCGLIKNGIGRRSNTEKFIESAIKIHHNTYDYSEVIYVKSNQKVIINCKNGHKLEITPNDHLDGRGCMICYRKSLINDINKHITTAKEIHKNPDGTHMFDYSNINIENYKGSMYKVPIKCNQCQTLFEQSINCHVHHKQGCWECNQRRKRFLPIEEIIRRGQHFHILSNGLPQFDYSILTPEVYDGLNTELSLFCNGCNNNVKLTILDHLKNKKGCPRCSPPNGCSRIQLDWLNNISHSENIYIQHKCNQGEYTIEGVGRVDGYCSETNTVYEFHGCWFHGCPECFQNEEDLHPLIANKTYKELYERTIKRDDLIKQAGYNLVNMWEHVWRKLRFGN